MKAMVAQHRALPECMCAAYRDTEPLGPDDSPAIHSRRNEQENEDAWLVISAGTVVGDGCSDPYLFPAAVGRVHGLCQHAWDAAVARLHALDVAVLRGGVQGGRARDRRGI